MLYPAFPLLKTFGLLLEPCQTTSAKQRLPEVEPLSSPLEALKAIHSLMHLVQKDVQKAGKKIEGFLSFTNQLLVSKYMYAEDTYESVTNAILSEDILQNVLAHFRQPAFECGLQLFLRLEQVRSRKPELRQIPTADLQLLIQSYAEFQNNFIENESDYLIQIINSLNYMEAELNEILDNADTTNDSNSENSSDAKYQQLKQDYVGLKLEFEKSQNIHLIGDASYNFEHERYNNAALAYFNSPSKQKELQILMKLSGQSENNNKRKAEKEPEVDAFALEQRKAFIIRPLPQTNKDKRVQPSSAKKIRRTPFFDTGY